MITPINGWYFRKLLLYSQASSTKFSLFEKYTFFQENSFKILQIKALSQNFESFKTSEVRLVVVDFPWVQEIATSFFEFAISAKDSG